MGLRTVPFPGQDILRMDLSVLSALERAEIGLQIAARSAAATKSASRNPTEQATDAHWEAARSACQLFDEAVDSAAAEIGPFLAASCAAELMQFLVRERIAVALVRTFQRLAAALLVRFDEHRIVDNECYVVIVTDILTGEREEFGWTYGGGKAVLQWKVERLLALAGKGRRL